MARPKSERAHGPYRVGRSGWRVFIVGADGRRTTATYQDEAEARRVVRQVRDRTNSRTLTAAVDEFIAFLAKRGTKELTRETARQHLNVLLQLDEHGEKPLRWLLGKGTTLYEATHVRALKSGELVPVAADTHRNRLAVGKQFGKLCVRRGWVKSNPFGDVEPVGRRKPGKAQLRVDESRLLVGVALERAGQGDSGALATLLCLLLGMRASEVAQRQCRDVDDHGRLLWIPAAKTAAGRRTLEIPAVLQAPLHSLAAGRPGDAPLFRLDRNRRNRGAPADRHWVLCAVRRLCRLAKVPIVSAHGLRGTHATLATSAGASAHIVAASLGHAGPGITQRAYIDATATERARGDRAQAKLLDPVTTNPDAVTDPDQ